QKEAKERMRSKRNARKRELRKNQAFEKREKPGKIVFCTGKGTQRRYHLAGKKEIHTAIHRMQTSEMFFEINGVQIDPTTEFNLPVAPKHSWGY
ncbi:hypothetical protein IID24_05820, partial [Patescibacteria group bacterium]|nr:hypothetical protein [Patescibacteria group bacterium]